MQTSLIVIDDFYTNPEEVRNFALAQPFDVKGNYPGVRTRSFLWDELKTSIQGLVRVAGGEVTNWFHEDGLSGSFQLCTAQDRTWIHADNFNSWAGVCYLTPNAPLSGGTALFKHKETGRRALEHPGEYYEGYDYTKWEMTDRVANIFNRLILYRGNFFHASLDYFGSTPADGRLFQVFFFNTEF